jgi:hypothetical protein
MITGAGMNKSCSGPKNGADYIVKDIDGRYLELVPVVINQLLHQQRLVRERQEAPEAPGGATAIWRC